MDEATDAILAIEKGFWTGGEDYFLAHADSQCLVAFARMSAVMARAELAATVSGARRWSDPHIEVKGVVRPTEDLVVLSYEARSSRGTDEEYHALVSSAYICRRDGWKLVFHAHTPIEGQG